MLPSTRFYLKRAVKPWPKRELWRCPNPVCPKSKIDSYYTSEPVVDGIVSHECVASCCEGKFYRLVRVYVN